MLEDVIKFKKRLSEYMSINPDCTRNKKFCYDYVEFDKITFKCKLYLSRPKYIQRIHYWWEIDGYIYDPTIHQFGYNKLGYLIDSNFRETLTIEEKNAFDYIINLYTDTNPIYDEYKYQSEINEILRNWYFSEDKITVIYKSFNS